jgi:hypothetical protein
MREHQQVVVAPALRRRVLGRLRPHLLREPREVGPDGLPHRLYPAVPLARDEPDAPLSFSLAAAVVIAAWLGVFAARGHHARRRGTPAG